MPTRKAFRWGSPPTLRSEKDALMWSVSQNAFKTLADARTAYNAVAILYGVQIYQRWIDLVNRRKLSIQHRNSLKMWEEKQTGERHER